MTRIFQYLCFVFFIIFSNNSSWAGASLNSQCYFRSQGESAIQGIRADKRVKIASVSKVLTSHWAITTLGANYQFKTKVFLENDTANSASIHLEGDFYPYFDIQMLQNLVSELNKLGIYRLTNLSFDESFIYASNIRFNSSLAHSNQHLESKEIAQSLRRDLASIQAGYSLTLAKAQSLYGMQLQQNLKMSVGEVTFLSRKDFHPSSHAKIYDYSSVPLHRILKEMNRNSNNYVADLLFEKLGGSKRYETFIKKRLGYSQDQVRFLNGSGYPVYDGDSKIYNEASCGATVRIIVDLRQMLATQFMDLENILPVAGVNAKGEVSTVSQIYNSGSTRGALIAKTGTIADTISLAGMISADEGDIIFGVFYKINGTKKEVYEAYAGIRAQLEKWTKEFGGKDAIDYNAVAFLPFDKSSVLTLAQNSRNKLAHGDLKDYFAQDLEDYDAFINTLAAAPMQLNWPLMLKQ